MPLRIKASNLTILCVFPLPAFAEVYFIFFILVCVFVMLNLFILVLIQYFEDYHMKEDNPLDAFNENLSVFRAVWA